jgi:penicillin-binding protein 2
LRPLNDRAIQGKYSPGSTFKMAVATAALEEGVITPDFKVHCGGSANFFGRSFKCWKPGGTAPSISGTRSRGRATFTSTRSAT